MKQPCGNTPFDYIVAAGICYHSAQVVSCCVQVLIVQCGGEAFNTQALSLPQWAACLGFGALGFLVRSALLLIPTRSVDTPLSSAARP